jgi:hypothetical protein
MLPDVLVPVDKLGYSAVIWSAELLCLPVLF